MAQGFLFTDELLRRAHRILGGLVIRDKEAARNLEVYGTFAATERLLMELVKAGADRQEMHERIRRHSLAAWEAIERGEPNPLAGLLVSDPVIVGLLPAQRVQVLLDAGDYVGDAPQRALEMAEIIRSALASA
jgi:adenylosuccinate lyase